MLGTSRIDGAVKKVDDLRARAETCRKAIDLLERVQELHELLEEANRPNKKKRNTDVAGAAGLPAWLAWDIETDLGTLRARPPSRARVS